jgi:serine/threonine protein kinase
MVWVSDEALRRLSGIVDTPDLSGTKYRLVRRIGRGGMGTVYLAEDMQLERQVALKVLHLVDTTGEAALRMQREARILARLEHPGIVPVHDVGVIADGRVFYVMKLVDGTRLDRYRAGPAFRGDLLRVFQKICDAVAFAHSQGVIHRDLKPENVMVGPFGEVLVMDWGVAKLVRDSEASARRLEPQAPGPSQSGPDAPTLDYCDTAHGTVVGTPAYMSPEQSEGSDRIDHRTDIYGLGAILYFLLTGQAPGEERSGDGRQVPRALRAIWTRAMDHSPGRRYQEAADLSADVGRFLDGASVSAHRESLLEKTARLVSRNRTAFVLILAYLAMRLVLLVFMKR